MKTSSMGILIMLIFSISLTLSPYQSNCKIDAIPDHAFRHQIITSQDSDPSILITTDQDFEDLGFPGNGTDSNPYMIENLTIASSSICTSISTTSAFFIIRNCVFLGKGIGVRFMLVSNGRIENCTFLGNRTGIRLIYSEDCLIQSCRMPSVQYGIEIGNSINCTFQEINIGLGDAGGRGVFLEDSSNITIDGLTLAGGSFWYNYGLEVMNSENLLFSDLYMEGMSDGINIQACYSSIFQNITQIECQRGLHIAYSDNLLFDTLNSEIERTSVVVSESKMVGFTNCSIIGKFDSSFRILRSETCYFIDCRFENSSLDLDGDILSQWIHTFINVSLDGLPIGYYKSLENEKIDISSHSHVIVVNCKDLQITSFGTSVNQTVLSVAFSSNCTISDTQFSELGTSLVLILSSDQISLTGCSSSNWGTDFWIRNSRRISFSNVRSSNSLLLIERSYDCYIDSSLFYQTQVWESSDCTMNDTQFTSRWGSITLFYSINFSFINIEAESLIDIHGDFGIHWDHNFQNVTIADSHFGYYFQVNDSEINGWEFGQIILYQCNDVSILGNGEGNLFSLWVLYSTNVILENLNLTGKYHHSLYIYECVNVSMHTSKFYGVSWSLISTGIFSMENCEFWTSDLRASSCRNIAIMGNLVSNSQFEVINLQDSIIADNQFLSTEVIVSFITNTEISRNRIVSDLDGIRGYVLTLCDILDNRIDCANIGIQISQAESTSIAYNSITGAYEGINMTDGLSSTIRANKIYNSTSSGIGIAQSESCNIIGNFVSGTIRETNGGGIGIYIAYCMGIRFHLNILVNNQGYGVLIQSTGNSRFWGNYFQGNAGDAREIGISNVWNSSDNIGNCWVDQDNLTAATIEGAVLKFDVYPITIVNSTSFPIVSNHPDLVLGYNETEASVTWIIWTISECRVVVEKNGVVEYSDYTDEPTRLNYYIANMTQGIYNLTLVIYVDGEVHTMDTVIIHREASYSPVITILGALGLLSAVGILELLRRRKVREGQPKEAIPIS